MYISKFFKLKTCGFSLMEIIVVLITLGALASIALPSYRNIVEQNLCRSAQLTVNAAAVNYHMMFFNSSNPGGFSGTDIDNNKGAFQGIKLDLEHFTYAAWVSPVPQYHFLASRINGPEYTCTLTGQTNQPTDTSNLTCSGANVSYCQPLIKTY